MKTHTTFNEYFNNFLTVEPQATQTMVTTKTPEQLQAEAEAEDWLNIWHEFTRKFYQTE